MKIGIDISQVAHEGTGVARFTRGFVKAICRFDKNHEWIFLYASMRKKIPDDVKHAIHETNHKLISVPIPPTLLSHAWNDMHTLPVQTFINNLDWFITSDWTEPPASCNKATIVHDLVYLRHPETVDATVQKTQQKRMHWVKKETSTIFTDSRSSANDIEELLKIEPKRIMLNYPGVDAPTVSQATVDATKKKHLLNRPFILAVGKIEPRKNLARLIKAFLTLHRKDLDLVIVGQKGWNISINELLAPHVTQSGSVGLSEKMYDIATNNIKFLGFVPDQELTSMYKICACFAFPSIWEGFGYPVIEAMQQGAPVIGSDTSSTKELLSGHAIMFDPYDAGQIAAALRRVLEDATLRARNIEAGKAFAASFTWERYYNTVIETLSSRNV